MDLTPWMPAITAVVAAAAALLGTQLSNRQSFKIEERRISREAERDARQVEAAYAAAESEEANTIASLYNEQLVGIERSFIGESSAAFNDIFPRQWALTRLEFERAIARVRDDFFRETLRSTVYAVSNASSLVNRVGSYESRRRLVADALQVGFEVASTAGRNQALSSELLGRALDIQSDLDELHRQHEEEDDMRRAHLAKRRAEELAEAEIPDVDLSERDRQSEPD